MVFQRRHKPHVTHHIRQTLWPKMGWWRLLKYYRFRIVRLSSPASSIAANLAGGAAMSFTPFFGLHVLMALGFAWLIGRGMNVVAAMVGTFIGNPWTFPFLLFASYSTGVFTLNLLGFETQSKTIIENPDFVEEQGDGFWTFLMDNFQDIFVPTAIGGSLLAVVSWPIYYYFFLYLVKGAQRARRLQLLHRRKKRQKKL